MDNNTHITAIVKTIAKALWRLDCNRADTYERCQGRTPPAQWADPWHESGCGIRQQKTYIEDANTAIRAITNFLETNTN
jgi:hypothetical protein